MDNRNSQHLAAGGQSAASCAVKQLGRKRESTYRRGTSKVYSEAIELGGQERQIEVDVMPDENALRQKVREITGDVLKARRREDVCGFDAVDASGANVAFRIDQGVVLACEPLIHHRVNHRNLYDPVMPSGGQASSLEVNDREVDVLEWY